MTTILIRVTPTQWNDATVLISSAAGLDLSYTGFARISLTASGDLYQDANANGYAGISLSARGSVNTGYEEIDATAYGVNVNTGGHFKYTNFRFNSFFRMNGEYYGCNDNGIFKLSGDADFDVTNTPLAGDGTESSRLWRVTSGLDNYGIPTYKKMSPARITTRQNNDINLKIVVDEQVVFDEIAVEADDRKGLHAKRMKMPRGIKGTVWQFSLYGNGKEQVTEFTVYPIAGTRTQ